MKCPQCDKRIKLSDHDSGEYVCSGCRCLIKIKVAKGYDAPTYKQDEEPKASDPGLPESLPSHGKLLEDLALVSTETPIASEDVENLVREDLCKYAPIKFHCIHCGQGIDTDESRSEEIANCPVCGGEIEVPAAVLAQDIKTLDDGNDSANNEDDGLAETPIASEEDNNIDEEDFFKTSYIMPKVIGVLLVWAGVGVVAFFLSRGAMLALENWINPIKPPQTTTTTHGIGSIRRHTMRDFLNGKTVHEVKPLV